MHVSYYAGLQIFGYVEAHGRIHESIEHCYKNCGKHGAQGHKNASKGVCIAVFELVPRINVHAKEYRFQEECKNLYIKSQYGYLSYQNHEFWPQEEQLESHKGSGSGANSEKDNEHYGKPFCNPCIIRVLAFYSYYFGSYYYHRQRNAYDCQYNMDPEGKAHQESVEVKYRYQAITASHAL